MFSQKKLSESLIYKFEVVFFHYDDHFVIKEIGNSLTVGITQKISVILLLIAFFIFINSRNM